MPGLAKRRVSLGNDMISKQWRGFTEKEYSIFWSALFCVAFYVDAGGPFENPPMRIDGSLRMSLCDEGAFPDLLRSGGYAPGCSRGIPVRPLRG